RIGRILTCAVIDVAGLIVRNLVGFAPRATTVFRCPSGGFGQTLVIHFATAGFVYEGEVGCRRLTQGGHRRSDGGGRGRASCGGGTRGCRRGRSPVRGAAGLSTQSPARQAKPAIDPVLEERRAH